LKFEELYNEAALHVDELAERVLALGGHPVATMKAHLEQSSLKEAIGSESAAQMVETIIEDFSIVIEEASLDVALFLRITKLSDTVAQKSHGVNAPWLFLDLSHSHPSLLAVLYKVNSSKDNMSKAEA
jgi:hypothetical protein